jgi:amino acid transporter
MEITMSRLNIQRIHATVMILLGVVLSILITISRQTGTGVYPFLKENPMAHVGLIQAYMLMGVIGLAYWLGISKKDADWKWDVLGIVAHIPPVIAVFMNWNAIIDLGYGGTIYQSFAIHGVWIAIELFAIFGLKGRKVSVQSTPKLAS